MKTAEKPAPEIAASPERIGAARRKRRRAVAGVLLAGLLTAAVAVVGAGRDDGAKSQAPSSSEQPLIPFVVNDPGSTGAAHGDAGEQRPASVDG